ncbi:hypothetical protein PR202_ga08110 [Eleusine coracana subsp. coracana]|uniref:Uncharacterized protein n=1 Tax=Eleusine coracana subsp. coracana TaxID=191504 RepID=A0AAV5C0E4_ELECO|nr:hypothetical protein PR202_ga08110 [Eleusine coracana subsp. coracana]
MEYAHFPQRASGSTYIHVEPVQGEGKWRLKKQVTLSTFLTKELDSTIEGLEFWQEKYEEAMKTVRKLKRHLPEDEELSSNEELEEKTWSSSPRKMASRAPPAYIIPNSNED